jgi:hypothetical protein
VGETHQAFNREQAEGPRVHLLSVLMCGPCLPVSIYSFYSSLTAGGGEKKIFFPLRQDLLM